MADLTRATGQSMGVTIEGQKFVLSPITIGDMAEFEKAAKEQRLDNFMNAAKKAKMDKADILEGMSRILTIPFTSEDFSVEMATPTGIRFILWRSIAKKNPKFTLEQAGELSNETLDQVMKVIESISNLGRVADGPPEEAVESP